jgi:hypothetical protein
MDSSLHGITPLRQRMIDDMRMRKFADKTQSQHIRAVRQLAIDLGLLCLRKMNGSQYKSGYQECDYCLAHAFLPAQPGR